MTFKGIEFDDFLSLPAKGLFGGRLWWVCSVSLWKSGHSLCARVYFWFRLFRIGMYIPSRCDKTMRV